jgi:hypothetical protein
MKKIFANVTFLHDTYIIKIDCLSVTFSLQLMILKLQKQESLIKIEETNDKVIANTYCSIPLLLVVC